MEWDADFLYHNNLLYSKELLNFSQKTKTPLIYASSASVYGAGKIFKESVENSLIFEPFFNNTGWPNFAIFNIDTM